MTKCHRSCSKLHVAALLAMGSGACAGNHAELPPSPMTYSIIVVNGVPVEGGGWPPTGGTARTQLYAWVSAREARRRYGWDAPDGVLCIVTDPALAAMAPAKHWDVCLQAPHAD